MNYKAKHLFAIATVFSISACSQTIETHQPKPPTFLNVSYVGNGDFTQRVLYSGIDTTLEVALNNIIPLDWGVGISPDVKGMKTPVSWDSNQPWINALGNVVRVSGVYAVVDFERRYVEIKKSAPKAPTLNQVVQPVPKAPVLSPVGQSVPNAPVLNPVGQSVPKAPVLSPVGQSVPKAPVLSPVGQSVPKAPVLSPVGQSVPKAPAFHITSEVVKPKPKPVPVWEAKSGVKLSDNVNDWAKRAGWRVVWEGADYDIEVPFQLKGEFLQVIKATMELYKKADEPLKASSFPSQELIVVSNKNKKD